MSRSEQLLREVKEEVELEQVNGGSCTWYGLYADMMSYFFGSCHNHTFCKGSSNTRNKPPSYPTTWRY